MRNVFLVRVTGWTEREVWPLERLAIKIRARAFRRVALQLDGNDDHICPYATKLDELLRKWGYSEEQISTTVDCAFDEDSGDPDAILEITLDTAEGDEATALVFIANHQHAECLSRLLHGRAKQDAVPSSSDPLTHTVAGLDDGIWWAA